jgi:hypothetical protein
MIFILGTIALIAYIGLTFLSFSDKFVDRPFQWYGIGASAGAFTMIFWLYLVRTYGDNKNTVFYINLCWDVAVCLMFVILPIIFCNVKLDVKSVIGCVIAVSGLIIMKV